MAINQDEIIRYINKTILIGFNFYINDDLIGQLQIAGVISEFAISHIMVIPDDTNKKFSIPPDLSEIQKE